MTSTDTPIYLMSRALPCQFVTAQEDVWIAKSFIYLTVIVIATHILLHWEHVCLVMSNLPTIPLSCYTQQIVTMVLWRSGMLMR